MRRRAVGTRDRIIAHLAAVDEISDPAGMASTRLAGAVGYPGSSVAFAQLLSGMERDGLIVREIRGKRTYRITLPDDVAAGSVPVAGPGRAGTATADGRLPAAGLGGALLAPSGFDYDELARRLLVQVVRRLAATTSLPNVVAGLATVDAPSAVAETESAALRQTVVGLERELATAWSRHGTLTAENARLREQLREAQRDLARERNRREHITSELNQAEVVLLERLLSSSPGDDGGKHTDATAS